MGSNPTRATQTSCGCSVQRLARLASNQLVSVRIRVPVLFANNKSSWSSGVLACLSRKRSSVQIRSGTLSKQTARYANRKSGGAQTSVTCLWVRFPPALLSTQPSGGTGRHATLRMSCPSWRASSTLALATFQKQHCRCDRCPTDRHEVGVLGSIPRPATWC